MSEGEAHYVTGAVLCGGTVTIASALAPDALIGAVLGYITFLALTPLGIMIARKIDK